MLSKQIDFSREHLPDDLMTDVNDSRCVMCEHEYSPRELTKHHLVPKSRKGKITVPLCRPCHRQVHALYTEKELEDHFGTLELLLAAEALQPWIRWIRKRKPTAHIKTKVSKRKRR